VITLLPEWLMPDAQPGDWYQWTLVAAGHVMLGAAGFTALRLPLGHVAAWGACLGIYLVLEALQLAVGGGIVDGLTDALFVVGGMAMAGEAMNREPYGFCVVVAAMTLAGLTGVAIRT
jgi:hypothetical protein